jgi:seryl-tRNA synthetase
MIEIKFVRQNFAAVQQALETRGGTIDWDAFSRADAQRVAVLGEIEQLRHRRNVVSGQIAVLKKERRDAEAMMAEMRSVGDRIKRLETDLSAHDDALNALLMDIPNIPHPSVPRGRTAEENPVVRTVGDPPRFDFQPRAHWDIGEQLGILDLPAPPESPGPAFPSTWAPGPGSNGR